MKATHSLLAVLICLVCISCGMYKPVGKYRAQGTTVCEPELVLGEDHLFSLQWSGSLYSGTWYQSNPKEIILLIEHTPQHQMWFMERFAIRDKELHLFCKRNSIYLRFHWLNRVSDDK